MPVAQQISTEKPDNNFINDPTTHIGQPKITTCVPAGQWFMVKTHQVEHCCLQANRGGRRREPQPLASPQYQL